MESSGSSLAYLDEFLAVSFGVDIAEVNRGLVDEILVDTVRKALQKLLQRDTAYRHLLFFFLFLFFLRLGGSIICLLGIVRLNLLSCLPICWLLLLIDMLSISTVNTINARHQAYITFVFSSVAE